MRNHHYVRNALTLGTSLTALFLLVRCSVPGRDYSSLGIGETAGSGGDGAVGDGTAGASAGLGGLGALDSNLGGLGGAAGLDGLGGLGGQDAGTPIEPIPCSPVSTDAGTNDAGSEDAGSSDAGSEDTSCACVDGFIRAVDADGDGDGTRACSISPGLDCDDGDPNVTHNSCGGCAALPNAVGEDCLDCGAYICDGPDSVVCATKPAAVVVDPDCRCLDALIVARDTDGDGQGSRICEQNPGSDCNDGDPNFVTDVCGGCNESLPGTLGGACNECGVYACNVNNAMVCAPSTGGAGQRCLPPNTNTRQTCVGTGFWGGDTACGNVCYQGSCEVCTPGTFLCGTPVLGSEILYKCLLISTSSSYGINWTSWASCTASQTCNAMSGSCTGYLFLPRDRTFDVVPSQPDGVPWHDILNTASDSDYG